MEAPAPAEIGDLALLSDRQGAALVDRAGCVQWWCAPDVDSDPTYARLLDPGAGHCWVAPLAPSTVTRRYLPGTMVLESTFATADGVVVLTDALLLGRGERGHQLGREAPHILARTVRCKSGEVTLRVQHAPRPEWGRASVELARGSDGAILGGQVSLRSSRNLEVQGGHAVGTWTLHAGEVEWLTVGWGTASAAVDAVAHLADTVAAWASWTDEHQAWSGFAHDEVIRGSLALQALTHAPTGAIVAAPSTSLPEGEAEDATWDYRYAWLRDTALVVKALSVATCVDEARSFFDWIVRALDGDDPQVLYGIHGEREVTERELTDLEGFHGQGPVRTGNDAWHQQQLDVPGHVLSAALELRDQLTFDGELRMLIRLADLVVGTWREEDSGIWEGREGTRHYTSSKVMCWAALDCALQLADDLGATDRAEAWRAAAEEIRTTVLEQAWCADLGAYAGALGSDHLDASVLLMPLVGFLPADDPRMLATMEVIERDLGEHGHITRWTGAEGSAFAVCGFWLAEAWAMAGQLNRAEALFHRVADCANDVGLLAEETDPATGAAMGNTPQALSHVGLINAAWRIEQVRQSPMPR